MVNEGGEPLDVVVRVIFDQEVKIVREEVRPLREVCARPGFVLSVLRQLRDSALNVIGGSHGWLEVKVVPTGLEHQVGLPAGYSDRGPLPPNAVSIEPFLSKEEPPHSPETDGLPN